MIGIDATNEVNVAWITGIFALAGVIAAAIIARIGSNPKTPTKDPDAKTQSPPLTYSGEQNDFMRLVIKDSTIVHERLDQFESTIETMKKERHRFEGAFVRYIKKLADSWGKEETMPLPDPEDFRILEETLPTDWRRRTK